MDCNIVINKLNWETPLVYACTMGRLGVVQLMIENYEDWEIDCKRTNGKGQNGLMVAMEKGHVDIVKLLVAKSKDINLNLDAYDLDENTALMIGSKNKQTKAISALFEKDNRNFADPNWTNKFKQTAFMLACQPTHNETKDERMLETILLFIKQAQSKRIDLKAKDDNGKSATDFMTSHIEEQIKLSYPHLFDNEN